MWPARGIVTSSAPGTASWNCHATASGERASSSPHTSSVGTAIPQQEITVVGSGDRVERPPRTLSGLTPAMIRCSSATTAVSAFRRAGKKTSGRSSFRPTPRGPARRRQAALRPLPRAATPSSPHRCPPRTRVPKQDGPPTITSSRTTTPPARSSRRRPEPVREPRSARRACRRSRTARMRRPNQTSGPRLVPRGDRELAGETVASCARHSRPSDAAPCASTSGEKGPLPRRS